MHLQPGEGTGKLSDVLEQQHESLMQLQATRVALLHHSALHAMSQA